MDICFPWLPQEGGIMEEKIWRGKYGISRSFLIILQCCSISDPVSISEVNNLPRLMRIHTFHIVGAYTWLAG